MNQFLVLTQRWDNIMKEFYCLRKVRTEYGKTIRKDYEAGKIKEKRSNMTKYTPRSDGLLNTLTTVLKDNYILEVNDDVD